MKLIQAPDDWQTPPYEQYVLVTVSGETRAYPIEGNEPLDLATQLAAIYPDHVVRLTSDHGPNHAAIVTDSRPPATVVVWQSGYFYL